MSSPEIAELLVIDEVVDRGLFPTYRAGGIGLQIESRDFHGEGVEAQEPPGQCVTFAQDNFYGLYRLNDPYESRQNTQDTGLLAVRGHFGRRGLRVETAIARAVAGIKDGGLTLKLKDASMNIGLLGHHAGVVYKVTGREIVTAIDHDVVVFDDIHDIFRGQLFLVRDVADIWVECLNSLLG